MSQVNFIPCQQCGYESPENARFCRSCGAALAAENELTAAATRTYGRQEATPAPAPASAPMQSAPLPPSIVDAFSEPTARQYVPPQAASVVPPSVSNTNPFQYPAVAPQYAPPYSYGTPPATGTSKRRKLLKWGAAASVLALAFGIGAAVNDSDNNARLSPDEQKLIAEVRLGEKVEDRLLRISEELGRTTDRRTSDLLRQIDQTSEEARRAAERGIKADNPNIPLLELDKYEYAEATVSNAIRIPGKELVKQHVKTDFATLVAHYETLLGKPLVLKNPEDEDEKRALFQSAATPDQISVSVFIKNSDEYDGQWEVQIMRSPFKFPRASGLQPAVKTVVPPAEPVVPPAVTAPPVPVEKAAPVKPATSSPKN